MEGAGQLQPVGHTRFAWSKAQPRFHSHRASHYGRVGANAKLQQIFNSRIIQNNIEFYIVTFRGAHADHGAFAVNEVCRNVAFTGWRYVSPLVPSTMA